MFGNFLRRSQSLATKSLTNRSNTLCKHTSTSFTNYYSGIHPRYFATDSSGDSNRLLLTLSSPSECPFKNTPVASVTLPGVEGEMTISAQHSPFVSFLRNGVITVKAANSAKETQYFVSDGLCLIEGPTEDNPNTTAEVIGVELVPTEFLDKEKTAQVLQDLLQSTAGSADEWDKARSLLGQELCSAVMRAAQ